MDVFKITSPTGKKIPFILSIHHSGTFIPDKLLDKFNNEQLNILDDTDWFLDQLYDFAPKLGVTTIKANLSRWVVDLNRNPKNQPLYNDGRIITAICPETNFNGKPIYKKNYNLNHSEISARVDNYFLPYHQKLKQLINYFKNKYGRVVIWDAHSIKRFVSSIHENPFPDLIIGNNDGKSCDKQITELVVNQLNQSNLDLKINTPFKGGYITRSIGQPEQNINAIQLEMSKDLYMKNNESAYDFEKAQIIKKLLEQTFSTIIEKLT